MNSSPHGGIPGQRVAGMPKQAVEHAMRHPLLRALIPTNVGIFPHADGHKFESPNGTDQLVLIYCAKGRGWCEMGGHRHEVRPGDLLVIPPLTPHAFGADPDDAWTIPWVHLTGENVKMLLTQLGVTVERPILELGEDHKVLSLFDDTVTVAENDRTHTTTTLFQASQTVGHLFSVILRRRREQADRTPSTKDRIAECIDFMKQNLTEALQLDRLAAVANLSASQFSAVFRKETGCPPVEYLVRLRMEHARGLLEATQLSVKEIAGKVGYRDPAHFCRTFRSMYGVAPSDWKDSGQTYGSDMARAASHPGDANRASR